MPDLDEDTFKAVLGKRPEGMSSDDGIRQMIAKGYTFGGKKLDPQTLKPIEPIPQHPPDEPGIISEGVAGTGIVFALGGALQNKTESVGNSLQSINGPKAMAAYPAGTALKMAGGLVPSNYKQLAMMVGGASSLAGDAAATGMAVAKPVSKYFGGILADVVGALSGKDPEALKVLAANPKAMWQKATELFGRKHMEETVNVIEKDFARKGAQIEAVEDTLSGNFGTTSFGKAPEVMTRGALDNTRFKMAKEGFRLPSELAEGIKSPVIGKIPQDSPEYKFLIDRMKELNDNPRLSFGDALRIKRNIYKALDYGLEGSNGLQPLSEDASRVLKNLGKDLNKSIKSSISNPEQKMAWNRANQEYEMASQARSELKKQVLGQNARLTERKLAQLLREGRYDDEVLSRAQKLGADSAKRLDDLRDHIAAQQFKRWGKGISVSEGLMPGSPRLVGMGASAVGAGAQGIEAIMKQAQGNPRLAAVLSQALLSQKGGQ